MNRLYRDKKWLSHKVIDRGWSLLEVSAFCGVGEATIFRWMQRFEISQNRSFGLWVNSEIGNRVDFYKRYASGESVSVAREGSGLSEGWDANKSLQASERYDFTEELDRRFDPCPVCGERESSERCSTCSFDRSFGGVSSVTNSLKNHVESFREKVFSRDSYVCKECGDSDGLVIHFIVPFHVVRDILVMENIDLDLSSKKDVTTLIERGVSDRRFNDLENMVTLCNSCHQSECRRMESCRDDSIYVYYAKVIKVLDGDSIVVDLDLGFNMSLRTSIRLYGLNTEELSSGDIDNRCLAVKSKEVVREICIPGRKIMVRTYKPGKYGRWLATIILDSGSVNDFLISSGMSGEYYV